MTPRRALVIGAGHHGLVCAGNLAEAGWEVTVLEQGTHPGGAVHSCEGPLPGFVEDPCAGYFPLTRASPAFDAVGLERENPSLVDGDLGGGSAEIDQQLVFRPAPELSRYRTPLRGLYLASASVHPGPGVHGGSGAGASRAVLADASALRPWRRRR